MIEEAIAVAFRTLDEAFVNLQDPQYAQHALGKWLGMPQPSNPWVCVPQNNGKAPNCPRDLDPHVQQAVGAQMRGVQARFGSQHHYVLSIIKGVKKVLNHVKFELGEQDDHDHSAGKMICLEVPAWAYARAEMTADGRFLIHLCNRVFTDKYNMQQFSFGEELTKNGFSDNLQVAGITAIIIHEAVHHVTKKGIMDTYDQPTCSGLAEVLWCAACRPERAQDNAYNYQRLVSYAALKMHASSMFGGCHQPPAPDPDQIFGAPMRIENALMKVDWAVGRAKAWRVAAQINQDKAASGGMLALAGTFEEEAKLRKKVVHAMKTNSPEVPIFMQKADAMVESAKQIWAEKVGNSQNWDRPAQSPPLVNNQPAPQALVTVPRGYTAGMQMPFLLPNGRQAFVMVPPGISQGMSFPIQM
jgi:hypothetical protein